jgi:lactate permease
LIHDMSTALALVPVAVFVLAASRGLAYLAGAALAGAAAAAIAAGFPPAAIPRALWIALPMCAVIFAGVMLREVAPPKVAPQTETDPRMAHRRLFVACFLLGPFFECAVGFGIGAMFALPFVFAARRTGANAAALAMLTQCLVPWGALALGPMGSADIAGVSALAVGQATVDATIWTLPPFLLAFWWLVRDLRVSWLQRAEDALWLAGLWFALDFVGDRATPDAAGLAACAIVAALRLLWDERPGFSKIARILGAYWPYVALTAALVASRLVPEIGAVTKAWAIPTAPGLPDFAPFHHAAFWLALIALAASRGRLPAWTGLWTQSKRALYATSAFVLFGEMLAQGGFAEALVRGFEAFAGDAAIAVVPLLGALGGAGTGSALAASAVNLPLTLPLMGDDKLPAIGAHVAIAAAFTAFSPARVVLVAGLARLDPSEVYRALTPLACALVLASSLLFVFGV